MKVVLMLGSLGLPDGQVVVQTCQLVADVWIQMLSSRVTMTNDTSSNVGAVSEGIHQVRPYSYVIPDGI